MEQKLNVPSPELFFTNSIEEVRRIYLNVKTEQIPKNNFKNQIVTELDGTLRCLSIPNIYYGLDDVDVIDNINSELRIHIDLLCNH